MKSTAASANAQRKWTLPIFLPEVPSRLPLDSLAHFTKPTIGDEILHAGKARDVLNLIQNDQRQNLANPGDRL